MKGFDSHRDGMTRDEGSRMKLLFLIMLLEE